MVMPWKWPGHEGREHASAYRTSCRAILVLIETADGAANTPMASFPKTA
jgi:hypothetical protein